MDQPISIDADTPSNREAARDSLLLIATVRRDGKRKGVDVRVRNLSAGGMMADCTQPFIEGEAVTVGLRNIGEVEGRVVWSSADRVGVEFEAEIDPLLARKPAAEKTATPHFLKPPPGGRPPLKA